MKVNSWIDNVALRNVVGVFALLLVYFIPDRFEWSNRVGFARFSPYLFLLTMYGWIVFHNRLLFEGLYLKNRRTAYFTWTLLYMTVSSIVMHLVLIYRFNHADTLSKILTFWVFTLTGLGVYIIFKYLHVIQGSHQLIQQKIINTTASEDFKFMIDGNEKTILFKDIFYIESLENYVRIITQQKPIVARLSMKEAETKLPKPIFLRVSRSHIINTNLVTLIENDSIKINGQVLKIGKVYKRYVEEQLLISKKNS
jgi:LytTr DNA-binding domain